MAFQNPAEATVAPSVGAPITVLVADDHPVVRAGISAVLNQSDRYRVVGEASDGEDAWNRLQHSPVDLAIIDVRMPKLDGLSLIARARAHQLPTEFVIVTVDDDSSTMSRASDFAVRGFVMKDNAIDDIVRAVDAVASGRSFDGEAPPVSSRPPSLNDTAVGQRLSVLTPAERTVLRHLAANKTSKEIAATLRVSVRTVQNHRANVCEKLGFRGTNKLLQFALENKVFILADGGH